MIFPRLHIEWERWKWNPEYELWVSNLGNFKDAKKKIVKPKVNQKSYLVVQIPKADHYVLAHRLVMKTWCPIDNAEDMTVDHLDHNKRNNKVANLEWVTAEENHRRAVEDYIDTDKKPKHSPKVKFVPTAYTLEHFYLCCNGLYFANSAEVLTYMRTQNNCVSAHHRTGIDKAFQTLVNAYNNQNPEYVANGFVKTIHRCELSIVKKGV